MTATPAVQVTDQERVLAVSLELAKASWKVGLNDARHNTRVVRADAPTPMARLEQALAQVEQTRERWALPSDTRVVVIYEAGQDGFWIKRALRERGIEAHVIDPASLPVPRHRRRAKTDRIDARRLVSALLAWLRGDRDQMRAVHMPDEAEEASRHWRRERKLLQKEICQHRDRIRKLLRTVGCWQEVDRDFGHRLSQGEVRDWRGRSIDGALRWRLSRELERLEQARAQLKALEAECEQHLLGRQRQQVRALQALRGIGETGSLDLVLELFWRDFDNRRQVGAATGLVPQPHSSGDQHSDQGISKQGNARVRSLLVEMAWMWLRYQPESRITRWFAERTRGAGKRARRVAIVAVARRLAIALWRYLEQGVVPEGARLKPVY